jgi:thioredoxin 1
MPNTAHHRDAEPELTDLEFPELTLDTVEAAMESDLPGLISFAAHGCGPCTRYRPVLQAVAGMRHGQFDFWQVETTREPTLASRFEIASVPAVAIVVKGRPKRRIFGARSEQFLIEELDRTLSEIKGPPQAPGE